MRRGWDGYAPAWVALLEVLLLGAAAFLYASAWVLAPRPVVLAALALGGALICAVASRMMSRRGSVLQHPVLQLVAAVVAAAAMIGVVEGVARWGPAGSRVEGVAQLSRVWTTGEGPGLRAHGLADDRVVSLDAEGRVTRSVPQVGIVLTSGDGRYLLQVEGARSYPIDDIVGARTRVQDETGKELFTAPGVPVAVAGDRFLQVSCQRTWRYGCRMAGLDVSGRQLWDRPLPDGFGVPIWEGRVDRTSLPTRWMYADSDSWKLVDLVDGRTTEAGAGSAALSGGRWLAERGGALLLDGVLVVPPYVREGAVPGLVGGVPRLDVRGSRLVRLGEDWRRVPEQGVSDGEVYVFQQGDALVGYDVRSGAQRWRRDFGTAAGEAMTLDAAGHGVVVTYRARALPGLGSTEITTVVDMRDGSRGPSLRNRQRFGQVVALDGRRMLVTIGDQTRIVG